MTSVLFVCLGNICRSPTAHGVFEQKIRSAGHQHGVQVDSCGTGSWHVGEPPDRRAAAAARARGYPLDHLRARQLQVADFDRFDYILAMDQQNLEDIQALQPGGFGGHLGLFLAFDPEASLLEVPDPYYGGADGFDRVLDLVERACDGLLREVVDKHLTQ